MRILTGDFASELQRAGHRSDQDQLNNIKDLPEDARLYLRHVEEGLTIRALAREIGCHPSTILRRIRRFETKRDDPLVDAALSGAPRLSGKADERRLIVALRRLGESGAVMAVMEGKETVVIARKDVCTGTLDKAQAEMLALRGWVVSLPGGRQVKRYVLTARGRDALRDMRHGACDDASVPFTPEVAGMAEAGVAFDHAEQHRVWEERRIQDPEDGNYRQTRVNLAESPLLLLARRRDGSGTPFLTGGMVAAGERLREDFELAQMGPRVTQNWEGFLTAGTDRSMQGGGFLGGSSAARNRVAAALRELGPGLGDVALRVCCFLEGLEMTERRLSWPARSGKVVLRLALQRLEHHYQCAYGTGAPLIG